MKVSLIVILLASFLSSCARPPVTPSLSPTPVEIRKAVVAGRFYPREPDDLRKMVDAFLEEVEKVEAEPIAIVVPHAGYIFSGQVAAYAFKQIEGVEYEAIVVIGPNHSAPSFRDISVYAEGAFETPLGLVPINEELSNALIAFDERIVFDRDAHRYEHSIEVELPFLQRVLPGCEIVPVVIGQPSIENCKVLGEALIEVLADKKALIIASSDMSHYPSYEDACLVDASILAAIETMDPDELRRTIEEEMGKGTPNLLTCLCGEGPVLVAMMAAKGLGANRASVLKYANSGDTPFGERHRVVGYGAVMFWREEGKGYSGLVKKFTMPAPLKPMESVPLTRDEREKLLEIAWRTIVRFLETGTVPFFFVKEPGLLQRRGAFVTLKKHGNLRGCIGELVSDRPLYLTVQRMAIAASVSDARFPPLTLDELGEIEIEISVLSPLEPIEDVSEIEVGLHGLVIIKGKKQGVFLPQVAKEQGWDREELLRQICLKAGLPEDAWRGDVQFYVFTADVFSQAQFHH